MAKEKLATADGTPAESTPDSAEALRIDALQKTITELTAERDQAVRDCQAAQSQCKQLTAALVKAQPASEVLVTLPTRIRPLRNHKLRPWATPAEIAKATGLSLAETTARLAVAVADVPALKRSNTYSIYGTVLWRYLGFQFVPPGQ